MKKINFFNNLIIILLFVISENLNHSAFAADSTINPAEYKIYLALYRGITNAERGFMDYLRDHHLAAKFTIRDAHGDAKVIPQMLEEIRALKPDLIYSFGTTITAALAGTVSDSTISAQITDIPILFNIVADPVGANLVADLTASGRNLTGTTHAVPLEAQFHTLREAMPCQHLGILYNPHEPNSVLSVDALESLTQQAGIAITHAPVRPRSDSRAEAEGVQQAVRNLLNQGVDVVYLPSDSFVIEHAALITQLTTAAGVPTFAATEDPIRTGGATMGLTSAYYNVGQFAGYKAEQILNEHRKPAEIPIESIDRFAFVVNVDVAQRLQRLPPLKLLLVAELICSKPNDCPIPASKIIAAAPQIEQKSTNESKAPNSELSNTVNCDPKLPYLFRHPPSNTEIILQRCVKQAGTFRQIMAPPISKKLILLVQRSLNDRGFPIERLNGKLGSQTREALRHFQIAQGLTATGQIDFTVLDRLKDATTGNTP